MSLLFKKVEHKNRKRTVIPIEKYFIQLAAHFYELIINN